MKRVLRLGYLLLVVLVVLSGCKKKPVQASPPSADEPVSSAPEALQQGDRSFAEGDLETAVSAYESYLAQDLHNSGKDRALFRIGVAHALPGSPLYDPGRAVSIFEQVAANYPNRYGLIAKAILEVQETASRADSNWRATQGKLDAALAELDRYKALENSRKARELADESFTRGDYAAAVEAYQQYLEADPKADDAGLVRFRLAIAYSIPQTAVYNPRRADELLRELAAEPESPYNADAKYILRLKSQISRLDGENTQKERELEQLRTELEKLKEIDLQRRRPEPPPP